MRKPFVRLPLFLVTLIFLTPAIAQSIFGTILGTVTDPRAPSCRGRHRPSPTRVKTFRAT